MKKILIVGASLSSNDAVSIIVNNLLTSKTDDIIFYVFGYSSYKKAQGDISTQIVDLSIKDPRVKIIYKILNKTCKLVHFDQESITSAYAYRMMKHMCHGLKFDLIVSLSGPFCFANIAYRYSKKHNIPLRTVYFDPYVDNLYALNKKKRKRKELKWAKQSEVVLYSAENSIPRYTNITRTISFKIPIFISSVQSVEKKNSCEDFSNYFVYGGTFYPGVRSPDSLFELADRINGTNTKIYCYSTFVHNIYKNILYFKPLLSANEYKKVCSKARGLIYIGNSGGNSTSSKFLEYISLKKPIIGINVSKVDEVRKYPYYIDISDDICAKLVNFEQYIMNDYNPYIDFPDRRPEIFFDQLFR